jgi:hypothetical protein
LEQRLVVGLDDDPAFIEEPRNCSVRENHAAILWRYFPKPVSDTGFRQG